MPIKVSTGRAQYFWIHGINSSTGNGVVLGPYHSEEEAKENAGNLGEPRFFKLPTRDSTKATRMIKHKIYGREGIAKAMKKVGHKMSGKVDIPDEMEDQDDDDF